MNEKPIKPDDSECCGSGCRHCVFDVYKERLRKWETKKESFTGTKVLDQMKYLPFLIIGVENIGDFLKVFQFQAVTLKKENINIIQIKNAVLGIDFEIFQEPLKIRSGEYLIIKGLYESEIISRSYTPVLNQDSFENGGFTIIISLQANGKMTKFFRTLKINDIVFWRGPFQEFRKDIKLFRHVLLFGGGTGVVPLFNIAKTIVEDEENETWVKVFASFKTVNSIVLRKEFGTLRDFWNFQMNIYVSSEIQSDFRPNYNESLIFKRIDETVIEEELRKCNEGEICVIVCGPEGFNHFIENALRKFGLSDRNIFIFW